MSDPTLQQTPTGSAPRHSTGPATGHTASPLASFRDYLDAQQLVDRMSDEGFPVEHTRIVGDGVRTVEHVTGRLTTGRAALAGSGGGAWTGLLIGVLLGLFAAGPQAWLVIVVVGVVIGAVWGAVFGFVAHRATRGRRDFSSVQTLEAQRYDVHVDPTHAAEAERFVRS